MSRVTVAAMLLVLAGCSGEVRGPTGSLDLPHRLVLPRLSVSTPADGCDLEGWACTPVEPGTTEFRWLARWFPGAATFDEGPTVRHREAIFELLWSGTDSTSVDRAIALLEPLVEAGDPQRATLDLAAAHLVRAHQEERWDDWIEALDLTQRRLVADPTSLADLHNLALIYEGLSLLPQAADAWARFSDGEAKGDWARWGAERAEAIETRLARAHLERRVPDADSGTPSDFAAWARRDPGRARAHAMDDLLARWMADRLAGRGDRAAAAVRAVAGELRDRSLAETISTLDDLIQAGQEAPVAQFAEGVEQLRLGRSLYESWEDGRAGSVLAEAERTLAPVAPDLGRWARYWRAASHFAIEEYDRARDLLGTVLEETDPDRHPSLRALALWLLGVMDLRAGRYVEAEETYRRMATLFEAAGETARLASAQELRVEALDALGRHTDAGRLRLASLRLRSTEPQGRRLHSALTEAASVAAASGRPHAALALQRVSLSAAREYGEPILISESHAHLARVLASLGRHDEASTALDSARHQVDAVLDEENVKRATADLDWSEAVMETARPTPDPSVVAPLSRAITFHSERGNAYNHARIVADRARVHRSAGSLLEARNDYRTAVEVLDRAARSVASFGERLAVARTGRRLFDELLSLHLRELDDPRGALVWGERARAIALGASPGLNARGFTELVGRLPADEVVVAFAEAGDSIYRWRIDRAGVRGMWLPVSTSELSDRVSDFVRAVRQATASTEITDEGSRLYRLLFPSDTPLPAYGRLTIIPDASLNGLPFAALVDESGKFLVQRVQITVSPGLASRWPRDPEEIGRRSRVLAVGFSGMDGELAAAPEEVDRVADLYREREVLSGPDATRSKLVAALPRADVFHFAGHAFFDPLEPSASWFEVSDGRGGTARIHAQELEGLLDRAPRLVVLSACSSIRPTPDAGGGFWGLARPFLNRGSAAVVGTLWPVADAGASTVAGLLHRELASGEPPSRALRAAQLHLIESTDPRLALPRLWAAPVVVGRPD